MNQEDRQIIRQDALQTFYDTFVTDDRGPCFDTVSKQCLYVKKGHPGCAIGALPQFQELLKATPEIGQVQAACTVAGQDEAGAILSQLGSGLSILVPLRVGSVRVGALLLLDLPDAHNIEIVMETLATLATIVSLILNSSLHFKGQERTIAKRTEALTISEENYRTLAEEMPVLIIVMIPSSIAFILE